MLKSLFRSLPFITFPFLAACGFTSSPQDTPKTTPTHPHPNQIPPAPGHSLPTVLTVPSPGSRVLGQPDADVIAVRAVLESNGSWTFYVTVQHPDTGWEDYADGWDLVTPDGTVLKTDPDDPFTRLLLHPHEAEQPFTRSQGGIQAPEEVTRLWVRAHDILDGFGGQEVMLNLTQDSGPGFTVER